MNNKNALSGKSPLATAGMLILKDMSKELPRSMNKAERDIFKSSPINKVTVSKEDLVYENGTFTKHTEVESVKTSGSLEEYVKANLEEGETNAQLGLYFFQTGVINFAFVKFNPLTSNSETDYFVEIDKEHNYLYNYITPELIQRYVKKHAPYLFPTLVVKPTTKTPTTEELNQLISEGRAHIIDIDEEEAEKLGLQGSEIKVDEFTTNRLLKQGNVINKDMLNIEVEK